jgi:membrane-bound inhibitor of C-type lysozyme
MKKLLLAIVILALIIVGIEYGRRNGSVSTTQDMKLINTVSYSCNEGKTIEASIYEGPTMQESDPGVPPTPTGKAIVKLSDGRELSLNQTISASGVRYANEDESFVFWNKGNGALILENNVEKSYIGCIQASAAEEGSNLLYVYSNGSLGFSIRLPGSASKSDYKIDESYAYDLRPGSKISGVKFTIPQSLSNGTNLSSDTYISVEELPDSTTCEASLFLDGTHESKDLTSGGTEYSIASSTGAGAGNRYEETVYAIKGTNPCIALRYFVHYGVIENYPEGAVSEFDKDALIGEFDKIRESLVIN